MAFSLVIPQITDISGLQARLDFWELFDRIALVVVFLGVLGELLAEFTNVFKTQNDEKRKKNFTVAFSLVLLVGLAGEFQAVRRTSRLANDITAILRSDIAKAFKNAGDAGIEASQANERAAQANEHARELENQNLKLAQRLETEKLARVQLQTAIEPRRLSAEDVKEITEASRAFLRPGVKILVRSTNGDEAYLAIQVAAALRDAGFDVDRQLYSGVFYELGDLCSRENIDIAQELIGIVGGKARMPITGMNYNLPPGSPVTLVIGLRHQGQLPKIAHSPSP
jgi:hypothetical protein